MFFQSRLGYFFSKYVLNARFTTSVILTPSASAS
jgi:hypothetical protein